MSKVIGIDLGTTNSCVSVIEAGTPTVIVNKSGSRTTPSVVALSKNELLIGETAKRQAVVNVKNTVSSIKRKMGTRDYVSLGEQKYLPQEISAMILKSLKEDAEAFLGEPVTEAVITVPAYFNDAQRQATKEAGKIAGLDVKRIINEPTAAALAYGVNETTSQKVLVYDLGGGTFDVSIIEFGSGVVEVLATAGNNKLGGDDFDKALVDHIAQSFRKEYGVDLREERTSLQRIIEAAENAKKELSSSNKTNVNIPFITTINNVPVHLDIEITRSTFENTIMDMINSTKKQIDRAISDADVKMTDIDKILLVGGSTRIPLVSEKIKSWTGKEPSKTINPDESVAMGAAIQGENLNQGNTSTALLLLDVTPLSLGVELSTGETRFMVKRNTTIPTSITNTFTTSEDFQTSVIVRVCQGERLMASGNHIIGELILSDITPAPRGEAQIDVTFKIDADGVVNVSAVDTATQRQVSARMNSKNMSSEEIEGAIAAAQLFEEADRKKKEQLDAKDAANEAIYKAKRYKKTLSDEEIISQIESKIDAIDKIINSEDFHIPTLESEVEDLYDLMNDAYELATSVDEDDPTAFYNNI